jgi:glutamine amidotransferase
MLHKKKIGIIDYDQGNIQSVINSLDKINVNYALCKTISDLNNCSHIILPGVGSFPKVLSSLRSLNFIEALNIQVLKQGSFKNKTGYFLVFV